MKKILFILFTLFIGVNLFAQTPKKELYRYHNYIFIDNDTVATRAYARGSGGGGGGGGVTAANLPLRISGSTVSADTSTAFAVALSTVQRLYKLKDSILGLIPTGTSYIQNQNSAAQSSSNFWISGNGRIQGKLLIAAVGYNPQSSLAKLEIDSNVLIYGAHSDATSNILELRAANTGARYLFRADGLLLMNGYTTAPSVQSNTTFYNYRTVTGNDDAGSQVWTRYNSGTPYAYIQATQSASTVGTAGYQFHTSNSGSDVVALQIEANGQVKTPIGLQISGSLATKYTSTATGITLDETHQTVEVTATGQTITLPTAASITGRIYTIKLTASGSCTVATTSSQNIDASTTYSLASQYKYVTVMSNGSNWIVIANN